MLNTLMSSLLNEHFLKAIIMHYINVCIREVSLNLSRDIYEICFS